MLFCGARIMRDLISNYKMLLKRKDESDSETQPLMSSQSSVSSFGAFNNDWLSETSEGEGERTVNTAATASRETKEQQINKSFVIRRPFCFPASSEGKSLDFFNSFESWHDRYEYFTKLSTVLCDTPQKNPLNLSFKDYMEENHETHSSLVTIFAVWNTIMGSSLLAMSWGLEKAGLFPGILLILFIAGVCLYTSHVLLKINEYHGLVGQHNNVSDLCRMLLGGWAETIAKVFSIVVLLGANIVYWILMSNYLYNSVHFLYGYLSSLDDTVHRNETVICPRETALTTTMTNVTARNVNETSNFDRIWDLYSTVPVILAVLLFPLLNFKSPTFFTKFNSLGTLSVLYLLVFVAVKGYFWGVNLPDWHVELSLKPSFCALSGMLSLAYFIHNIIISIMRNNRNQEKNGRDLSIAFGLVTFTYVFVGVVFYVCFPLAKSCIEDNIFNNFEKYDTLAIVARLLFLFQLFTVFPLISFMLRNDILSNVNAIFRDYRFGDFTYGRVMAINFFVVVVCVLFACFLPRIGTLIRYIGAFSGFVYIFLFPSLLKIESLRKKRSLTPVKLAFFVFIVAVGVVNLLSQFFITDQ